MMRAGQAAERRRAAEACAQAAREQLSQYWRRQGGGAPTVGLPARWGGIECQEQAERDAMKLLQQREKDKNLEERRNKLAMLLFNEDLQQKEELKLVAMKAKLQKKWSYIDSVPTAVLKEINLGIKAKEEEQRRGEAEILLYHQWRANQPTIREFEVKQRQGALKTAWMEQIVEKEVTAKKEEEENERLLKERDEAIERQVKREKETIRIKEEKMKDMQEQLCKQIQELRLSETAATALKRQEEAETVLLDALKEAGRVRLEEANRRTAARETLLSNMAMQARRLRERAREAQKDIEADIRELKAIADAVQKDVSQESSSRKEWQKTLVSVLETLDKQRDIERARQRHLDTVMDGEARVIFEKQEKVWRQEHEGRQMLLNDVLETLRRQVQERIEGNRGRQRDSIAEREEMLARIERDNTMVQDMEREREKNKEEIAKITRLQSEMKQLEREKREKGERMEREAEMREAAREEERLRREILRLQREGSAYNSYRRRRMLL